MPKLSNMQNITLPGGGNFQFSAVRPENLGATEYTLVTIVVDVSSSVSGYSKALLKALKSVIEGCRKSPRVDNLMVRLITFSDNRKEVHGFVPLSQIQPSDYKPLQCSGCTALYDAAYDAIGATNAYAKKLFDQDFDVNAAIYILTDGIDNRSKMQPKDIARQVQQSIKDEYLESLITVLVGVDTQNGTVAGYLQVFKDEAKLSQYVDISKATADELAKLAAFVSHSISTQSQALGSGNAAASLSF